MQQEFEHGGNIYIPLSGKRGWIDFSANINPLGLSSCVRDTIISHISCIVHYPDPQGRDLKEALALYYAVPYHDIILGNGATELLYVFFHCFRPGRVLIPSPSFSEYERAARAAGARVDFLYLQAAAAFAVPWDELAAACGRTDCIILGNPNNPTGRLLPAAEIERLVRVAASQKTIILVDESFLDFQCDADAYSIKKLAGKYPNLVVLSSLTKFYALPGLRLGFAVASTENVQMMEKHKDVWNVNVLAQYAGVAALADRTYQEHTCLFIAAEKKWLYNAFRTLHGVQIFPSSANFLLMNIEKSGYTSNDIEGMLRCEGILIRTCANYPGLNSYYMRVAVRLHQENELLIAALKKIL